MPTNDCEQSLQPCRMTVDCATSTSSRTSGGHHTRPWPALEPSGAEPRARTRIAYRESEIAAVRRGLWQRRKPFPDRPEACGKHRERDGIGRAEFENSVA